MNASSTNTVTSDIESIAVGGLVGDGAGVSKVLIGSENGFGSVKGTIASNATVHAGSLAVTADNTTSATTTGMAIGGGLVGGQAAVADSLALTPRQLPSRYFYDALGSALFEAICELPWYRITRTERALLARCGRSMVSQLDPLGRVIELGPGNGSKLKTLVESGRLPHDRARSLELHLIDLSARALADAEPRLQRIFLVPRARCQDWFAPAPNRA